MTQQFIPLEHIYRNRHERVLRVVHNFNPRADTQQRLGIEIKFREMAMVLLDSQADSMNLYYALQALAEAKNQAFLNLKGKVKDDSESADAAG